MNDYEKYIREHIPTKRYIDDFLNETDCFAKFDPEVGYILGNSVQNDGIDHSLTISTAQENGARASVVYASKTARINTYGNSFTQCHQVSDHETWQEYLAAHLGEPVRNFGMGGHGVYQAYRRMLRNEKSKYGAEYVLLYIWGDDSQRSLLRSRFFATPRVNVRMENEKFFHGNFWSYIEMDFSKGCLVEKEQFLNTPKSLYKMTDPDIMVDVLKDDVALQMLLFCRGYTSYLDIEKINKLAEIFQIDGIAKKIEKSIKTETVKYILNKYAFSATKYILEKTRDFLNEKNKKLMVVLSCPIVLKQLIDTGTRYDQEIVDYLEQEKINYFDMNLVHIDDFACFNLSYEEYVKRYWIGHYSPAGNHFFAHSIKKHIVDWLDPKPITYQNIDKARIDFNGYLEHLKHK